MDFTLTGKAAIVTGAAGSIGAWYARTLAPASDWTTGQCLNVDGGWVMRT